MVCIATISEHTANCRLAGLSIAYETTDGIAVSMLFRGNVIESLIDTVTIATLAKVRAERTGLHKHRAQSITSLVAFHVCIDILL